MVVKMCVHPSGHYSSGADRKFALLEDVFKKFPKTPVSIEIKENNSQLMEKVTKKKKTYKIISKI